MRSLVFNQNTCPSCLKSRWRPLDGNYGVTGNHRVFRRKQPGVELCPTLQHNLTSDVSPTLCVVVVQRWEDAVLQLPAGPPGSGKVFLGGGALHGPHRRAGQLLPAHPNGTHAAGESAAGHTRSQPGKPHSLIHPHADLGIHTDNSVCLCQFRFSLSIKLHFHSDIKKNTMVYTLLDEILTTNWYYM